MKPASGPREFIRTADRCRGGSFRKHTNVRPAHLGRPSFLGLIANQNCGVLREGLRGCPLCRIVPGKTFVQPRGGGRSFRGPACQEIL